MKAAAVLPPLSPACVDCGQERAVMITLAPGVDCGNRPPIVVSNHEWLLCSLCWRETTRKPDPAIATPKTKTRATRQTGALP